MEKRMVEFVDGPRAGKVATRVMPKFIAIGRNGKLRPINENALRVYVLSEDGKYHYLEVE